MATVIRQATIITPFERIASGSVLVDDGRITSFGTTAEIGRPEDSAVLEAEGHYLFPGLIDLHTHGLEGTNVFGSGLLSASSLYPAHGVTSFMATTVSAPRAMLHKSLAEMAGILANPLPGAICLGIHLEGPFLSPLRPGMADPASLEKPTLQSVLELQASGAGWIKRLTFAPEEVEESHFIDSLRGEGITPVAGHTAATFEQMNRAFDQGLDQVAHIFNAMSPLHHRGPGPAGAALLRTGVIAELIADGIHLHPAMLDLLIRLKGVRELMLVSDSSPLSGLDPGEYEWAGQSVIVKEDRCALLDGTLAGSYQTLEKGIATMTAAAGVNLEDAVQMATAVPAQAAKLTSKGRIASGYDADLVLMDKS
jgi:N-acetylglucosamine-6-phosphate deacetylase